MTRGAACACTRTAAPPSRGVQANPGEPRRLQVRPPELEDLPLRHARQPGGSGGIGGRAGDTDVGIDAARGRRHQQEPLHAAQGDRAPGPAQAHALGLPRGDSHQDARVLAARAGLLAHDCYHLARRVQLAPHAQHAALRGPGVVHLPGGAQGGGDRPGAAACRAREEEQGAAQGGTRACRGPEPGTSGGNRPVPEAIPPSVGLMRPSC